MRFSKRNINVGEVAKQMQQKDKMLETLELPCEKPAGSG